MKDNETVSLSHQSSKSGPRGVGPMLVELFKARLVTLVVVTTAVGFVMASPAPLGKSLPTLLATVFGTALAAAGSMALNEAIEWRRDARMRRTQRRPVPAGALTPPQAALLGIAVAAAGTALLAAAVNLLTALLALLVVVLYTLVYTPLKTRSSLCTMVGAVCGAVPPMMGWSAATGTIGTGGLILGGILFLWQIPHFLSLAWLYRDDYERGGFRVLPADDANGATTGRLASLYSLALVGVTATATLNGMTGLLFAGGALALGAWLVTHAVRLASTRSDRNARTLFLTTLAYLPLLLAIMVADRNPCSGHRAALVAAGPGWFQTSR